MHDSVTLSSYFKPQHISPISQRPIILCVFLQYDGVTYLYDYDAMRILLTEMLIHRPCR